MVEKTKELVEVMNKLLICVMAETVDIDTLACMDDQEAKIMTLTFKALQTSTSLLVEHAKLMESMNDKLDKLISKKENA